MALKLDPIRLLIADDVGIGKTIEAGLIARELIDRGEIKQLAVLCPPHLCEQWQQELAEKFSIEAEVVRTGTAARLERGLRPDESIFEVYPYTVVSLDYIKSDRRRSDFLRACPELVLVDEAHTCVQSNTAARHQRYQLLKGLAESEPKRNMVFLTATPHSGDDAAFHNLLGLLDPRFAQLAEMPEGEERSLLRQELAGNFVQRRRGDIAEWKDAAGFPVRESREATYRLIGDWGQLFDDVLSYARTMVEQTKDGTKLQQRMSWWAALALLRCISSSPAAAGLALRTRLQAAESETELDQAASETVLDAGADDALTLDESVPAGTLEAPEDAAAQRRLRPGDVLPEWRKAVSVLGGPDDVVRFVCLAAERLGAPLDQRNGYSRLPVAYLPKPLQDRLGATGFKPAARLAFAQPAPTGATYIHRAHPLVAALADYVAEQALDAGQPDLGARASAMFTRAIRTRTVLYLLRLRSQLQVEQRGADGRYAPLKSLLTEECLGVAVRGSNSPQLVPEEDALSLLSLEPGRNMEDGQKTRLIGQALDAIPTLEDIFTRLAHERARELLADHRRIREASDARGLRYDVIPALPVDKIGVYVFVPVASL